MFPQAFAQDVDLAQAKVWPLCRSQLVNLFLLKNEYAVYLVWRK